MWQRDDVLPDFPDRIVPCPVPRDALIQPYSLKTIAQEKGISLVQWERQQQAQHSTLAEPKLTKKRKPNGRSVMTPLSPQTLQLRDKCLEEFVGFAVKWQGQQATFALVLQPQLAAKFFGFLLARGEARQVKVEGTRHTIKKHATQLSMVVEFVMSDDFPGEQPCTVQHATAVRDWFANVRNQVVVAIHLATVNVSDAGHITYYQAISYANGMWETFLNDFKVGSALDALNHMWGCPHGPPAVPSCPPPTVTVGKQPHMDH